jgi:hypothetical protein
MPRPAIVRRLSLCFGLALFLWSASLQGQRAPATTVPIPFADAQPILEALREVLPPELAGRTPQELQSAWPAWVRHRNQEIRARLLRGDEDSIINLLFFGTRFTHAPRVTASNLERLGDSAATAPPGADARGEVAAPWIAQRLDDLVRASAAPGQDDRLRFVRSVLEKRGISPITPQGAAQARAYLLENLSRVSKEQQSYRQAIDAAHALGDATEEFIQRSTMFHDRGLSLDTSLLPNMAIERSLAEFKKRGWLAPGSVRRVAVIGPGLDFTDKSEGFDFYPLQTIQPFALMDSLLRLGLVSRAAVGNLQVFTFDLSPRINDHIARARDRARRGMGYTLELPRSKDAPWKPESVAYWERFGDQIGNPVPAAAAPPEAGKTAIRAIQVSANFVSLLHPLDLNIVLERYVLPHSAFGFDLIIATNILVYYDTFEQSLALQNIAAMLRPGGFLLTNNVLLVLPASPIRSVGNQTTVYSDRPDDGDHIIWYRLSPNPQTN